jgi:hypothetical protein
LASGGGGAGDGACCAGNAGWICGGWRRKDDEIGSVEICAVQQIEDFCAKLKIETLVDSRVFQDGEIPIYKAGTADRVSAQVAVKTNGGRGRDQSGRIEPFIGLTQHDWANEVGIHKRSDRISGVAVVRRVVAQLRSDGKSSLRGEDAGETPSTDEVIGETAVAVCVGLAAAERQIVENVDDAYMRDVESGEAFIGGEIEGIGRESRSIACGGLIHGVAIIEGFREGVNTAERKAVAEAAANVHLKSVVGTDAFGKPCPSVGEGWVGSRSSRGNVVAAGRNWSASERRTGGKTRCESDRWNDVGIDGWIDGGTWGSWADGGNRFVGVDAD